MRGKKPLKDLKLSVPVQESPVDKFLTASGTFKDGELRLNQSGLRLISEENGDEDESTKLKVEDVQLSMDDLEMIQVIGKGSGGVVQLVRHKWVGTLYALKVIPVVQIYLVVTQLMHRLDVEYAPSRCRQLNLFCFSIIVFLGLKSNPFFFKWHMVCVFSDNQNFLCLIMWFLCLILSAMAWPHSFHFTPYILVNEVEMPNE